MVCYPLFLLICILGKELNCITTDTPVRSCGISYSGNMFFFVTDAVMQQPPEVRILDMRVASHLAGNKSVLSCKGCNPGGRITAAIWGDLENYIITGTEKGEINMVDARTGEVTKSVNAHKGQVTDLQAHADRTMFISASKDHTAKVSFSCGLM